MSTAPVVARQHDGVLEIVLDLPERRNALSRHILREMCRIFGTVEGGIGAVVLTSSGPAFSAGADFADLTGTSADLDYDRDLDAACSAIRACEVPVVAAVNGPCVGAGVEVAASCDVRVAGPDAWFRVPAVELGLLYNPTSIRRLHATLPRATVTRLLLCAERFDADDAIGSGLATHRTGTDPRDFALTLAATLALLPRQALSATRTLLRSLDEGHWDADRWQRTRKSLLDSPVRRNAVATAAQRHGNPPAHTVNR
jgi:enoyl-CoA hydratase